MSGSFTDVFGRVVTQNADGTWTAGGITVGVSDQATALQVFNGMAPPGWTNPVVVAAANAGANETVAAVLAALVLAGALTQAQADAAKAAQIP